MFEAVFAKAHAAADETPAAVAVIAAATMPWWRHWLLAVSDAATLVAQAVAIALAAYKLWDAYRTAKGRTDATIGLSTAVGAAAKKSSFASGSVLAVVLTFLGVYAVGSWLLSSRANASPGLPVAVSTSKAARKRTKDDAGDEGTEDAPETIEGAPKWLDEGMSLVGTKEKIGRRSNPAVLAMFAEAGHPEIRNSDTPWCAAFVGATLERCGIRCTKALTARSYLNWGVHLDTPRVGCVVVIWRGSRNDGFTGHVFYYLGETATHIRGLGGNQGDAVTVALFPKSRVLGYRWPRSLAKSKTMAGAGVVKAAATGGAVVTGKAASELPDEAPPVLSKTAEAVDSVRGPLETVQSYIPGGTKLALYIALACFALAVVGSGIVIYQRWKIRDETGR